jgi:PAS domain S-box-containing protein
MTSMGNILAVDDTPASLKLLTELLQSAGYDVRSAVCGELALRSAITTPPELILLDVRMPGIDGFEVCRRLKAQAETREVPVIFVSALTDIDDKVEGFRLGAVDFVTKPFQREELLVRVRTQLEMARLCNRLEAAVEARARELKESKERYDHLVENIHIGVYQYHVTPDARHAFTYVSPRFCQLLGLNAEDVRADVSLPFAIIHPEDRDGFVRLNEAATREQTAFVWEGRALAKGETRWLHIESHPEHDRDGGCTWHGIVEDITDRRTAEEALNKAVEQLTESNRELERFAYVASHDLQEPLRNIALYAQVIQRDLGENLTLRLRETLGFVVDGAKRMAQMINGLLAYSRVNPPVETVCVSLGDACANALDNLREAMAETEANVVVGPLPEVNGNLIQLTQLFQNLIGNAIKFHRPEVPPRVEVSAERTGEQWLVTVADNGIGIADTDQDIFEIFRRLHGPADFPGSGIGLAICKRIAQQHGGRIWFQPTPDAGTVFFVALPTTR